MTIPMKRFTICMPAEVSRAMRGCVGYSLPHDLSKRIIVQLFLRFVNACKLHPHSQECGWVVAG